MGRAPHLIRPIKTIQEKFASSWQNCVILRLPPETRKPVAIGQSFTPVSGLLRLARGELLVGQRSDDAMRTTPQLTMVQRFLRSRDGNIAIVTALIMPVIVGFCALGAETSYWYYRHQTVQGAADIAAYGSAVVLGRGGEEAEIIAAAKADAITNGWRQASGTITVKQDGPFVEVLLIENQQRYFSRFLCGDSPVRISAKGVAAGFRGGAKLVWAAERPSKRVSSCASIAERSQRPQTPRPQAPERAPRARVDSDTARAK